MSALAVFILVLSMIGIAGQGLGRWFGGSPSDLALRAAAFLALWLVAVTQMSAAWGFTPGATAGVSVALGLAAWLASRRPGPVEHTPERAERSAELRLLLVAVLALSLPLLLLPVPLDTDAQGFGQLALAVRDGGDLTSLAPLRPGIAFLYAPGGPVLFASLSALLPGVAMSDVMMGASHALALLFVALAGTLGEELGVEFQTASAAPGTWPAPAAWRRLAQVAAALSPGLWTALLDAHYTAILGLTIGMLVLVACSRAWRTGAWRDVVLAGVALSALAVAHQDCALAMALGLAPLAVAAWLAARPGARLRVALTTGAAVALAAALITPWLLAIAPLLASGIASPFPTGVDHWRQMILYHGLVWPVLALAGIVVGVRRRPAWTLAMAVWLALLADLSITGVLAAAPPLAASLHRFAYPFSLAWHGPVLPYLALGTVAVAAWVGRRSWRAQSFPSLRATLAAVVVLAVAGLSVPRIMPMLAGRAPFYGALASRHDVQAMRWLRRHAPPDARVLNYPGDLDHLRDWEGHWAPVLTERDCVYLRMQPFFLDNPHSGRPGALAAATREQREMLAVWRTPSDPANAERLAAAGIRYVLVPEAVSDPSSLDHAWRGRPPALLDGRRSPPLEGDLLRLVFRAGGAAVYELR
jgi:hypothetical protein